MDSATVYSCGCASSSSAGRCLSALEGAGVQFKGASADGCRSSVLLFEEPDEEVSRFLQEAKRVIAVSLARPLGSGEVSGLLETGAADVLIWKDSDRNALAGRIKARLAATAAGRRQRVLADQAAGAG
ncbi:MAG: hypothetical protein ACTFAL_09005 [Candidatus Electronema sp. V4]|uniref:hypothetical protein n=1 Tax=Candidatus Electronema sp. V4 TaxID=3454756 RepID=UPI004055990B